MTAEINNSAFFRIDPVVLPVSTFRKRSKLSPDPTRQGVHLSGVPPKSTDYSSHQNLDDRTECRLGLCVI